MNRKAKPRTNPPGITTPADLEQYLEERYRARGALFVRDPEADAGFRTWTAGDTEALCRWINESRRPETARPFRVCHNLEQTAEVLGVGIQTAQAWLRREHNPLPHIRDGRRIIVPHFMLIRWMVEETKRSMQQQQPGPNRN